MLPAYILVTKYMRGWHFFMKLKGRASADSSKPVRAGMSAVKKKIIVTFSNKQKLENISKFLTVNYVITDLSKIYSDNVNLVVMDLDQGFEFEDYIVITENEVFKTRDKNVNYSRSRKPGKGI